MGAGVRWAVSGKRPLVLDEGRLGLSFPHCLEIWSLSKRLALYLDWLAVRSLAKFNLSVLTARIILILTDFWDVGALVPFRR